ncbi:hypothetical protein DID88_004643 [Monilinia fructigena]|uniref:Lipoyl-binding domain-containing protein n=1 Tax=Monilinia fructigena TaxID=38457 RepID=A0A395IRN7_9HELO|nr:hypothetical protein DID88_004643 [Monilinia fructigena]
MARKKVNYYSLGTFEFLVRQSPPEFFFLEINPRLQVEHTITESLAYGIDLVKIQLLLAQGHTLSSLLPSFLSTSLVPPYVHALQLRITAENPSQNFSLSPGKILSFNFPSGNGIRVDTHLHPSNSTIIGTDFDSLLAKLVITAPTWLDVVAKVKSALEDTYIIGIETNLNLLRAIVASDAFREQRCDTRWLEMNLPVLLEAAKNLGDKTRNTGPAVLSNSLPNLPSSNVMFRPRDSWDIVLTPEASPDNSQNSAPLPYHLQITRILTNNFPSSLKADILFTLPSSSRTTSKPTPYTLSLASATSYSSQQSSQNHRLGDPSNLNHIITPFPGKLIEICVEVGDRVLPGQAICVIRQMKMEVEVRSQKAGVVMWVFGENGEDGDEEGDLNVDVREGVLICGLEDWVEEGIKTGSGREKGSKL